MAVQNRLHRATAQAENLAAGFGQQLVGVERQTLSGVLRDDQRNAQRAFAVEFPIFVEVPQVRYQVRHYAAFFSTAKAAASSGSRICAARKRTTGTATPSPAR